MTTRGKTLFHSVIVTMLILTEHSRSVEKLVTLRNQKCRFNPESEKIVHFHRTVYHRYIFVFQNK